jgi:hypothetical protein
MGNKDGIASTTHPIGAYVTILNSGVEIFRGIMEHKESNWTSIGSTLSCSGREEMVFLTEDDFAPTK